MDHPSRTKRRDGVKNDEVDAIRAAREALGRDKLASPRAPGRRAALAGLLVTRASAVEGAKVARTQLQSLLVSGPEAIGARLSGLKGRPLLTAASRLRLRGGEDELAIVTELVRSLARRALALYEEADAHEASIRRIVADCQPELLERRCVGPIVAATVLCVWSHPGRFASRGRLRRPRRGGAARSLHRRHHPAPTLAPRRPAAQLCPARGGHDPVALRRGDDRLRPAPAGRGKVGPGDQALPEALRGEIPLPAPRDGAWRTGSRGGLTEHRSVRNGRARFAKHCATCPVRRRCTTSEAGRTIVLHPDHALLAAARMTAATTEFDEVYRTYRPMIGRTIAWFVRPNARKVRYRGVERNRLFVSHRAAAVNLTHLVNLGACHDGTSWVTPAS